ncbi:hypothetical protein TrLO_g7902 [Triparma laevis f. longispina]|uniref:Uncharacterized protein n=1 Tax=Triparma laevis f. longispina TaxID=1714387 RepID=A0A9W7FU95_9STRA|nr:hypothetical protein TrLO_g7902 [Triparma laevis f. longispina]
MMSTDKMDNNEDMLYVVGIVGIVASLSGLISEIYSSLLAQRQRAEVERETVRGKEEDRKNRAEMAAKMRERRGGALMEDQVEVFESCKELLGEEGEDGWKALKSTSQ